MVFMNSINACISGGSRMGSTSHLFCTQCGAANPLHARFCPVCGHALGGDDTGKRDSVKSTSCVLPAVSISAKISVPVAPSETQISSLQNVVLKQRYRLQKKV